VHWDTVVTVHPNYAPKRGRNFLIKHGNFEFIFVIRGPKLKKYKGAFVYIYREISSRTLLMEPGAPPITSDDSA